MVIRLRNSFNSLWRYRSYIGYIRRIIATLFRKLFKRSDISRWSNLDNILSEWESRSALIATMIVPNSKVLEFGAGHMALTKYLPKNCTYIPSDVVKRSPDTVICDLNAPKLPTLPVVDVVVLTGVFEYVNDIPRLISVFNSICHTVIASYAAAKKKGFGDICLRRSAGWVNDYTEEEFVTIFQNRGFILLERTMWREQIVCRFHRK